MMILTNCAACAAPLAHNAPRCIRCHTRYCDATCQYDHWRRGHKQICKRIHRGGNAEQYYADKKYKEAVAVAVEACAEDTKGQTCFICTQALQWKTKEGLVRGCACRGTAGFAHVSCLAEQAKILVAEVEENNLGAKVLNERWKPWNTCSLCEQHYHGIVQCALGWACWKTYVGRPETDELLGYAISELAGGLSAANHLEDALSVGDAELAMMRRIGAPERNILAVLGNNASLYQRLGRIDEALPMFLETHVGYNRIFGEEHWISLMMAQNYANTLTKLNRFKEARSLLRKILPVARRHFGNCKDVTLKMLWTYAETLYRDDGATLDDLREAVTTLEEVERPTQRVFGISHPLVTAIEHHLRLARAALHARGTRVS